MNSCCQQFLVNLLSTVAVLYTGASNALITDIKTAADLSQQATHISSFCFNN